MHLSGRAGRKDMPGKQVDYFSCNGGIVIAQRQPPRLRRRGMNQRIETMLNHYKEAIFPHGRVIKNALVTFVIGTIVSL